MPFRRTIRTAALLASLSLSSLAQSAPQPPASAPQAAAPIVTYASGKLTVTADNTSLNQILRDISRQLGMKITGGVKDDRVYGTYGPAAPAVILNKLLDDAGSNVLIVQPPGPGSLPTELILTPRNGGPTPPNPNAEAEANRNNQYENQPNRQPYNNQRFGNNNGPIPMQNRRLPPEANAPSNGSSNMQPNQDMPQSPNGVPTPQQIYQRRQQMQQQNNQQTQ